MSKVFTHFITLGLLVCFSTKSLLLYGLVRFDKKFKRFLYFHHAYQANIFVSNSQFQNPIVVSPGLKIEFPEDLTLINTGHCF